VEFALTDSRGSDGRPTGELDQDYARGRQAWLASRPASGRWGMRRAQGIPARFLLLAVVPLVVSSCYVVCGCTTPPWPNETPYPGSSCACATRAGLTGTPPPVGADEATTHAERIAGVTFRSSDLTQGPSNRLLYELAATDATAFVDAESGAVLEVILTDALPVHDTAAITEGEARAAAEAFMSRAGWQLGGLTESAEQLHRAGVAAFQVSWTDPTASPAATLRVLVNAETAAVFACVDAFLWFDPLVPVVGRARATEIALAVVNSPGMIVTSAEWTTYFQADGLQLSTWTVGLGEPSATQADVFVHGAVVSVDAATGEATIMKSDVGSKP
jgi:hypothetical protein